MNSHHESRETLDWPSVSIVTLNWNGLRHLETCYKSLHELDYPRDRLELILVDNGSADRSVEFVRSTFPKVKIIQNVTNLGFAKANNIGAQQATGKYVAFLNNDTRVDPAWLKELVKAVQSYSEVVCAASKMLSWEGDKIDFAGGNINFHGMGSQPEYGQPDSDALSEPRELLFACGGAMLIDRQVFLECGGFDEDFFIYFEDVDLGWRLWVLGYRVLFAPQAITYHRFHGDTQHWQDEKRLALTERNTLFSIIKNYDDENLVRILPAALSLMMERAFLLSGVNPPKYKLDAVYQQTYGIESTKASATSGQTRPQRSSRIYNSIRRQGLRQVTGRQVHKAWRAICQQFLTRFNKDLEAVPRISISPLVATHDVVQMLPRTMQKRAWIQQRRKRADAEILALFPQPFRPSIPDVLYEQVQNQIAQTLDICGLFNDK